MAKLLFYLTVVFLVTLSFLFSPRPRPDAAGEDRCLETYVVINRYMGFPVNCDAPFFVGAAIRPSLLLTPNFERQERPGYIVLGTIIAYPLYYLSYPLHPWMARVMKGNLHPYYSSKKQDDLALHGCCYLAFLLVNIAILLLVCMLFEQCLKMIAGANAAGNWVFPVMLIMLIANPLCKTFFWSAHQQLFNLLTPLLCLYGALKIFQTPGEWKIALSMSLLVGLGLLFYGNFIVITPVICLCYLKKAKENHGVISARSLADVLLLLLFSILPTLIWYALLKMHGITPYNREVAIYREYVWIFDEYKKPGPTFLQMLAANTVRFIQTWQAVVPPLIVLFVALIYRYGRILSGQKPLPVDPVPRQAWIILGYAETGFVLFLWLMGAYLVRLTVALDPLIILGAALLLLRFHDETTIKWLASLTVLALYGYTVLSYGPFS